MIPLFSFYYSCDKKLLTISLNELDLMLFNALILAAADCAITLLANLRLGDFGLCGMRLTGDIGGD